jgi:hypothetical protein
MSPEVSFAIMSAQWRSVGIRSSIRAIQRRKIPMPFQSRYLFTAAMDVEPEKEALFNEVYDKEHVPMLLTVPGVISVARFKTQKEVTLVVGGQRRTVVIEGEPTYSALYEIEGPEVLTSDAWGAAVDQGRWPGQVRPFTRNRRHVLYRRLVV